MRISSVIINNYKSIGTQKNALLLEDDVTALIGKNDSGKSNVLEILGAISFSHYILEDFYKFNNSFLDGELSLVVELKFTNNEINLLKEYKNIQDDITYFYFSQYREIEFKGGFSRLFDEDIELVKSISYLKKELMLYLEENYYDSMDSEFFCEVVKYINSMENINNTIWIKYKKSLNKLLYILNSYGEDYLCISEDDNFNDNMQEENKSNMAYDENRYTLIRHLEIVKSKIRKKYSMLPILYHRKSEEELQNEYQLEEVKKQIKDRRGALYKFILASEINTQEFLLAMENDDENQLEICRNKIKEKIKYNIQKKFNEFYCEENVQIKISFKKDYIKILVKTNENTTNINERSNGLRWYLNLFIDILANDIKDTNVIYLLDEPGVYLHVNAQRELLRLFYDLCKNDNQVVYSTHSPYMIDSNNIINIRAIEKDEKGHTNIYNTAYDNKLNSVSKRETLSPLVQAIGADLRFNIGPQGGKLNIVTEGITDYMYYTAMLYYFNVPEEKMPYIIPAVGAGNINVIVSILIGWGCDFKVILDYDKAGFVECEKLIENLNLKINEDIFFVNCNDTYNNKDKDIYKYAEFVETLISEEDKGKFSINYVDNKTMAAKEFYDKVKCKSVNLSDETVNNFKKLFKIMNVI
ncbi:MAG: AAA family ATPase [Terrisporobacter othiniensis]|uniref:AAA family ATPase n=1 Tax=Terrisporobacter othiniensis TaxID=1577792 RepID=UPI00290CDC75|nr:AAA family ATPase [Terrisporobacter othiniensis]MDU6985565.1 AAA family ATPase [Terrisporobacter othiniensis]